MSDPTPSNTRDNARREAHAERRARPLTRSLTPSATLSPPRNNKVSNHITNQIALTETMTPVASWWGKNFNPCTSGEKSRIIDTASGRVLRLGIVRNAVDSTCWTSAKWDGFGNREIRLV